MYLTLFLLFKLQLFAIQTRFDYNNEIADGKFRHIIDKLISNASENEKNKL